MELVECANCILVSLSISILVVDYNFFVIVVFKKCKLLRNFYGLITNSVPNGLMVKSVIKL